MIDVDSTICEVEGHKKQGAAFGYTKVLGYHPILATRADTGEVLHARMRKGSANTARGARRFIDELIARVQRTGPSGEIVVRVDSGFWSNHTIATLGRLDVRYTMAVRTGHKSLAAALAAIELAIRDLKEGSRLDHVPSGKFAANSAWLQCAVLAHDLIRWTATIARTEPVDQLTVARSVRRRLIAMPARLVNHAGTLILRCPLRWPWRHWFKRRLAVLRALPPAPG
ncbi:MAG: transposase [Actinobacteria bacterium]|nr:transposase [Actinomycetota bacterium]